MTPIGTFFVSGKPAKALSLMKTHEKGKATKKSKHTHTHTVGEGEK